MLLKQDKQLVTHGPKQVGKTYERGQIAPKKYIEPSKYSLLVKTALLTFLTFTANRQTSVLFLVGSYSSYSPSIKHKLISESQSKSDLIMADELIEHYSNLTLKTIYTLKFFLEAGLYYELWNIVFFSN